MADADVAITAGSGTKIDTRTVGAATDEHRQVIVVGDPSTAANVAAVQASAPAGTEQAIVTRPIPSGTQTVSGTVTANLAAGTNNIGDVDVLTLPASTVAGAASLPAGTNNIGDVDVLTLPAIPAGSNQIGTTLGPTLTKGTQGTTGYSTQDLKDAGRASVAYYMVIPVITTATDTLQSLTGTKANATVAATTTPAVVTAGKTFRIQRFWATYIATATSGYAMVRLRYNTAGVVAVTSPVLMNMAVGAGTPATANSVGVADAVIPENVEVPAGTGVGISVQGYAAVTATAVGYVLCGLSGYEY